MAEIPRVLITTALEDSWVFDAPVLFLGEWCKMYGRQHVWKNMDAKVVSFHWNDRIKLEDDYEYLCGLYERVLRRLANQLNEIHGVDHSLRYWRILIGPWLAYFIHILFDRWESIQRAVSSYSVTETTILTGQKESKTPDSMEHFFSELMVSHEWNHAIYAFIIEKFTAVRCVNKINSRSPDSAPEGNSGRKEVSLKRKIFTVYSEFAARFSKNDKLFLIATYLSAFDELKLHLRFQQAPHLWATIPPVACAVDRKKRNWVCDLPEQSAFEKCLAALIPMQIPATYLEGYKRLIDQTQNLPWPQSPRLIFTSNVLWHDTISMAYSASQIEKGAKLLYGQHGGFGLLKFQWAEKHEREIADRYLTWGWSDEGSANIVPVGILKSINKYKKSEGAEKNRLLLVRGLWPPYTFRLDSGVGLPQLLADIDRCIKFAGFLPESIRNNSLIVRLYPLSNAFSSMERKVDRSSEDYYCEDIRWRNSMPEVQLNDGSDPIEKLVVLSRLVIYTYNGGTGYLEFMAANVPVIAFWDMKASPVRDSAVSFFDDLKRVGIFHETSESAAAHVNKIWDDVEGWWRSTEVVEVLRRFKANYCHQPNNILDCVETVLRDVIDEPKDTCDIN
jgi:putative transferase (TIGR04331 family)